MGSRSGSVVRRRSSASTSGASCTGKNRRRSSSSFSSIHTFGANYREVLPEQREEWEQAHGVELEPLQLPVIPTGDGASPEVNTITEAAKELKASLTPKTPDCDSDEEVDISGDDISEDVVE